MLIELNRQTEAAVAGKQVQERIQIKGRVCIARY